jgi:hypothetical protein
MMPAPAMKPIMDVAVKNAPIAACAGKMPTRVKGIRAHNDQRSFERFAADNHNVDKHQDRRECRSQIAEAFG